MNKRIIKNRILILILGGLLISGFQNIHADDNIKKVLIAESIRSELKLHPKATLIDIYKFFFQDEFGPVHLISNPLSALEYIKEELNDTSEYDKIPWQEVGYKHQYIRVNLKLIKDSSISLQKLTDVFVKSANSSTPVSIDEWMEEWNLILDVIKEMKLTIHDFKRDELFLENNLKNGITVVHHSDIFIKTYNPHYRLISVKYIDEIKPAKDKD